MSRELTFDMLRTRKPKRGTCMRCFTNPTEGHLLIQAFDTRTSGTSPLVSLTTSMCLPCTEIMYRAIALTLTPAVTFGSQCPGCQENKPVVGKIVLAAQKQVATKKETGTSTAKYVALSRDVYKYCESCTVRKYRDAVEIRDESMLDGSPYISEVES